MIASSLIKLPRWLKWSDAYLGNEVLVVQIPEVATLPLSPKIGAIF